MACVLCASGNEAEFPVEMIIHFSGLKNVDNPGVWLFPKFLICWIVVLLSLKSRKPNWRRLPYPDK